MEIIKKLGLFIDGSLQRFSFGPPKTFKPKKQTTWNTSHPQGIAWSSGKLDYEKLSAVFYDIKVMNAEVFAQSFENCRLLTRLVGQKLENLDDYGCSKVQNLVKTDSLWICSNYTFRHETRFHCPESKAKAYGQWAGQHLQLLYVFILFVFTTILFLSTRRDFFLHFEKFSLRNR